QFRHASRRQSRRRRQVVSQFQGRIIMEFDKIRNLNDEEPLKQQASAADHLFRIRFQKSLGNTEGLKKLRTLKLDVARIQTVARQRALAAKKPSAAVTVALV